MYRECHSFARRLQLPTYFYSAIACYEWYLATRYKADGSGIIQYHFHLWHLPLPFFHSTIHHFFCRGGSRGCTRCARPLKLEKIWFFDVISWFFTRNTPNNFAPPSARRNFSKCAPLTWNRGSAHVLPIVLPVLRFTVSG